MRLVRSVLALSAVLMSRHWTAASAFAQSPPKHRLEVIVAAHFPRGAVADELRGMLQSGAWDDTYPELCVYWWPTCFGPYEYPTASKGGGSTRSLTLTYAIHQYIQLAAMLDATSGFGYAAGWRKVSLPVTEYDGYSVLMEPSVTTTAVLGFLRLPPGGREPSLRLGVGPAFYRVKVTFPNGDLGPGTDANGPQEMRYSRFGVMGQVGFALNLGHWPWLFVDTHWQYRWVPSVMLGPYDIGAREASYGTSRLDLGKVSFSHHAFGLGAGVRF